jgi:DNA-binding transcriptional ArsR family regulator
MLDTLSSHQIDQWLSALADPTRRRIVEMLSESPRTATEIHRAFPIADPAVSRHLRVLREAAVVVQREVAGDKRVRLYALAHDPIDGIATWLEQLSSSSTWGDQLGAFKDYVVLRQQKDPEASLGESS